MPVIPANPGGKPRPSWMRQCATKQKVAGSIPEGVNGIFHLFYPYLDLTEISTRSISLGIKGYLHMPILYITGESQTHGTGWAWPGLYKRSLIFYIIHQY